VKLGVVNAVKDGARGKHGFITPFLGHLGTHFLLSKERRVILASDVPTFAPLPPVASAGVNVGDPVVYARDAERSERGPTVAAWCPFVDYQSTILDRCVPKGADEIREAFTALRLKSLESSGYWLTVRKDFEGQEFLPYNVDRLTTAQHEMIELANSCMSAIELLNRKDDELERLVIFLLWAAQN
jgi:hypothetical protein